jgi:hypothetical protein
MLPTRQLAMLPTLQTAILPIRPDGWLDKDVILSDTVNAALETPDPSGIADSTAQCAAFADN